jgi:hypothetical protein
MPGGEQGFAVISTAIAGRVGELYADARSAASLAAADDGTADREIYLN